MSSEALAWAFKQDIRPSSLKFTLVAMCECANYKTGRITPSVAHLSEITGQDRKTVIANIAELEKRGLIHDTGERTGATKQVKVYNANNGTVPETEQSQKRNSSERPLKQSQKRDTEPSLEPSLPSVSSKPSVKRARAIDPFPKPEWADEQVWTDLKTNRKTKRVPNTPTAYAKFLREIQQWVNDAWPPGRVLEAIVARGWASAQYDPRENQTHGRPAQPSFSKPAGNRGERRNPCLDMLYAAEEELRAASDPEPDIEAWPSLRAIQ